MTSRRSPLVTALKMLVAGAVVVSIAKALGHYGHSLAGRVEQVSWAWLGVAFAASMVYRLLNAYQWVLVLRALRQRVALGKAIRLWLVTETLRWLPGSMWGLVSRAVQAKEAGVPPLVGSLSSALELFLVIASWGLAAVAGLALSGVQGALLASLPIPWILGSVGALVATVGVAFALARWKPSSGISRKMRGLRESLGQLQEARPSGLWMGATFVFMVAICFVQGAAFLAVLRATSQVVPGFLATTGINAVGWLAGFFAFFAPTGLGVREGGLTAMLSPLMPLDAVLVAVVLWRIVQIVAELMWLAICFVPGLGGIGGRAAAPISPLEPQERGESV
jgi:uncharacterized membrane protein YbhN (UPF0104 family)